MLLGELVIILAATGILFSGPHQWYSYMTAVILGAIFQGLIVLRLVRVVRKSSKSLKASSNASDSA